MSTTPTPSLKIKLRLSGLSSSQPSVSSSSSFSGTVPLTSSVGASATTTPMTVALQPSVPPSATAIPGTPLNQIPTTVVNKQRNRRKDVTKERRGLAKTSAGDGVGGQAMQGTPFESRLETPTVDSQPTLENSAMAIFKDKSMRPRKWRRTFMLIRTVGGGMELPVWQTDDLPYIPSLPNSTVSAISNSDGARAKYTPPVSVPIVKPPFDPARPFACPQPNCIKNFPSEDKLASHTIAVHGPKIHGCDMCWKRFGKKEQLARHRKTHLLHVNPSPSLAYNKARRTDVRYESETDEAEDVKL